MARSRLEFQTLLEGITENVYFQPPSTFRMEYPCIRYERDGTSKDHADNELYRHANRYQVTVIDRNPDTELKDQVELLKYSNFERFFPADDLNHYVFSVYF
jgi:hypothetical protein